MLVPTCLRPVAQRACAPRWQRLVETTGAVQVRRAEERCKEAERATKLGDAEVADAHRAQGHPIFNLDGSVHLEEEEQRMTPEQVNAFFNLDGLL